MNNVIAIALDTADRIGTIAAASHAAFDQDRITVVGRHSYFGWVYRDADDECAVAELTDTVRVDASGEIN